LNIDGWERRYRSGDTEGEDAPTALVVETAANLRPGKAIDLACGTGRNALYLSQKGWSVTAVDGSETAIEMVRKRAAARRLSLQAVVADLTAESFKMPAGEFDLIVIAYYLQRDLFSYVKQAVRPGGLVLAIVHTPEPGESWTAKRAAPGELRGFFTGWEILHDYEGPSRDPAHRRPVAEIVAKRPA
jgi:SAM-dependent methyltransferase